MDRVLEKEKAIFIVDGRNWMEMNRLLFGGPYDKFDLSKFRKKIPELVFQKSYHSIIITRSIYVDKIEPTSFHKAIDNLKFELHGFFVMIA